MNESCFAAVFLRPFSVLAGETMTQSAVAISGSFAPTHQIENPEIHKVFLQFPIFDLSQNLSPTALADLLIASHGKDDVNMMNMLFYKTKLNLEEQKLEYQ